MRPALPKIILLTTLTLGPLGVEAASYTSFWAFGDSLTDPGNLYALTEETLPPPPYDERASNGPVWAEHIAQDFTEAGLATGNFAYGYAQAVPNDDIAEGLPWQVPDLPDQIAEFEAVPDEALGAEPVAALWFGANDIFGAIETGGGPAVVVATALEAAEAVVDGIVELASLGVSDFVVFNLPPLELTPAYALLQRGAAPLAELGADVFNAALAAGLASLQGTGLEIALIDIDAAFQELLADPGSIGLSDTVFPCYIPPRPEHTRCSDEELATKVFFDPVHPTATVHEAIADLVRTEVAPVPLPPALAGLGAALLSLLAIGRRKPN